MVQIEDKLISDEVFEKRFVCNLSACKGACCVEGESGAPLEEEELQQLEDALDAVKPYMRQEGIDRVNETGVFTIDVDGDYVTPLVNDAECAFVQFDENGITKCAIEMAHRDGKTDFPKPISCHLYPIRLSELKDFTAINYHHWPICDDARICGTDLNISVFRFLKAPIIRKFGADFYAQMELADKHLESQKSGKA
jgi:hypothetical protein